MDIDEEGRLLSWQRLLSTFWTSMSRVGMATSLVNIRNVGCCHINLSGTCAVGIRKRIQPLIMSLEMYELKLHVSHTQRFLMN